MPSPSSASELAVKVLAVVAHPDDECVGFGAAMSELADVSLACVTDGAPHDMVDAWRAGCRTREEYARLREMEMCAAAVSAGHDPEIYFLRAGDQRASFQMAEIARQLADHFARVMPAVVMTHPYEGGHPDHDATALAVHAAVALRQSADGEAPEIVEMTSYHSRKGAFAFGEFLPETGDAEFAVELDEAARARKRELLGCHGSQGYLLNTIPLVAERFRRAPAYDFSRPPHEGKLLYEQFPWGMTGAHWRTLATAALEELGVRPERRRVERRPVNAATLGSWLRAIADVVTAAEVRS